MKTAVLLFTKIKDKQKEMRIHALAIPFCDTFLEVCERWLDKLG